MLRFRCYLESVCILKVIHLGEISGCNLIYIPLVNKLKIWSNLCIGKIEYDLSPYNVFHPLLPVTIFAERDSLLTFLVRIEWTWPSPSGFLPEVIQMHSNSNMWRAHSLDNSYPCVHWFTSRLPISLLLNQKPKMVKPNFTLSLWWPAYQ